MCIAFLLGRVSYLSDHIKCAKQVILQETKEKVFDFYGRKVYNRSYFQAYYWMRYSQCLIKEI